MNSVVVGKYSNPYYSVLQGGIKKIGREMLP
jgi:hypothetical protein